MSVQDKIVARIEAAQNPTQLGPLAWSAENNPLTILARFGGHAGQNDLSAVTSRLAPLPGLQVIITIGSAPGPRAVDTFQWKLVTNDSYPAFSAEIDITGEVQQLQDGLTVKFDATTGHTGNEEWFVNLDGELAVPATIRTGRNLLFYEEPGSDHHGSKVTFAGEQTAQWTQWTTNGGTVYGPVWQFLSTRGTFDVPADAHDDDFLGQIWFSYQKNGANLNDAVIIARVRSVADRITQLTIAASGGVLVPGLITPALTVAALPATPVAGQRAFVTDSNAVSFTAGIGTIVAAGGGTAVPVIFDGTNWLIG